MKHDRPLLPAELLPNRKSKKSIGMDDLAYLDGKGTYVLVLEINRAHTIRIGRLGTFAFDPGYYFYVGSALGPGGLGTRLRHHLRRARYPHWHIDYLRKHGSVIEIWYDLTPVHRECMWAQIFEGNKKYSIPVPGFGASDCGCQAHLFYSVSAPDFAAFAQELVDQRTKAGLLHRLGSR